MPRKPLSKKTMKALGARIRKARKELGMGQETASERADVSYYHYGALERGDVAPSIEVLLRIAKALGKNPSWFLEPFDKPLSKQEIKAKIEELAGKLME